MRYPFVDEMFTKTDKHFVDVSGFGNWVPRCTDDQKYETLEVTHTTINKLRYCPYCGRELKENKTDAD